MICFTVYRKEGRCVGFQCEGHAEFSEEGSDIVCSAVSALTVNTVNSLELLTEDAYEGEEAEEGGMLRLRLLEDPSHDAQLLLDSLILGIRSILETYGEEYLEICDPDA